MSKRRALKPPSKAVLREIADLADTPKDESNFYYDAVLDNVRNTCELKTLSDALTKKKSAKMHSSALTLQEALWGLNKREAKFIDKMLNDKSARIFNKISGLGTEGLKEIAYQLAAFFALLAGKPQPRSPSLGAAQRKRGKSPGGRRPGSINDPILQAFILDLWLSTRVAGGKLSFARSLSQGTMLKAMTLLAPHLPSGFVPRVLPYRRLQDLSALCNKLEAEYRRLEAE